VVATVVTLTLAGFAAYVSRAKYAGRCVQWGRGIGRGPSARSCLGGHTLHQACVKPVMGREVCPVCGIYVSELSAGANAV
jgi:hypothetical protein